MNWLNRIFSAEAGIERINPFGAVMMAAGIAVVIAAEMIAKKQGEDASVAMKYTIKIIGLIICAGGALLAILG